MCLKVQCHASCSSHHCLRCFHSFNSSVIIVLQFSLMLQKHAVICLTPRQQQDQLSGKHPVCQYSFLLTTLQQVSSEALPSESHDLSTSDHDHATIHIQGLASDVGSRWVHRQKSHGASNFMWLPIASCTRNRTGLQHARDLQGEKVKVQSASAPAGRHCAGVGTQSRTRALQGCQRFTGNGHDECGMAHQAGWSSECPPRTWDQSWPSYQKQ